MPDVVREAMTSYTETSVVDLLYYMALQLRLHPALVAPPAPAPNPQPLETPAPPASPEIILQVPVGLASTTPEPTTDPGYSADCKFTVRNVKNKDENLFLALSQCTDAYQIRRNVDVNELRFSAFEKLLENGLHYNRNKHTISWRRTDGDTRLYVIRSQEAWVAAIQDMYPQIEFVMEEKSGVGKPKRPAQGDIPHPKRLRTDGKPPKPPSLEDEGSDTTSATIDSTDLLSQRVNRTIQDLRRYGTEGGNGPPQVPLPDPDVMDIDGPLNLPDLTGSEGSDYTSDVTNSTDELLGRVKRNRRAFGRPDEEEDPAPEEDPLPTPDPPPPGDVVNNDGGLSSDEEVENENVIQETLRTFRTNLFVDRTTDENMKEFQRVFRLQGSEGIGKGVMLNLPGLRLPIYPYQLFGSWYMLKTENLTNGGFLADDMGLGKTYTIIALLILDMHIQHMVDRVRTSRKANDGLHNPESETDPQKECPSVKEYPYIECICVPNSPTRHLVSERKGANLVIVPYGLLKHWIRTWNEFVDSEYEPLRPVLLCGHADSRRMMATSVREQRTKIQIMNSDKYAKVLAHELGVRRGQSLDYHVPDLDPDLQAHQRDHKEGTFHVPSDAWRHVVITTIGSLRNHVLKPLTAHRYTYRPTRGKGSRTKQLPASFHGDLWRRAIRTKATKNGQAVERSVDKSWREHPFLKECTSNKVDELGQRFTRLVKAYTRLQSTRPKAQDVQARQRHDKEARQLQDQATSVATQFRSVLETIGFIRRTAESRWGGEPLQEIPKLHEQDRSCPLTESARAQLAPFLEDAKGRYSECNQGDTNRTNLRRSVYRLRIANIFPGLAALYTRERREPQWRFEDLQNENWIAEPENSLIARHLDSVLEGSARWEELRRILNDPLRLVEGKRRKIVIMSYFPIVILTLFLAIRREFPNEHARAVFQGNNNRQGVVDSFQSYDTGEHGGDRQPSPGVLLGTLGILSQGYTLTRANAVVLIEVPYSNGLQKQAFGRVHRIGQRHEQYGIRLVDPTLDAETRALLTQRHRDLLQEASTGQVKAETISSDSDSETEGSLPGQGTEQDPFVLR
ncbi:hypothetical protein PHISCL_00157 [Aspergillus sclerotialis]|uniref:SNF2 N-terminal domain-containing protein n=1 Tax=Aspergillus sclerotialis TaxID=2070753 RepID=A0A3A3AE30_9EURO|nr:hypothetical protein PHISCL_00157 [Aspergillus sclerotialis]